MTDSMIVPSYLDVWSEPARELLAKRYLAPGETTYDMLTRASFGDTEAFRIMAQQLFLPNTPTLVNGGREGAGTLSACFKFDVPDTMVGIMEVATKAALVLKFGGGVGYCLSDLRPDGSSIATTHKIASGPVGFMPIYQAVAQSVTQGGVRAGAQMAILHCDHPDVEDFINLKSTEEQAKEFSTFNISVAATDEWMDLYSSMHSGNPLGDNNNPLWRIAQNAWATGDPGLYFIDEAERHNPTPWLGKLTGTNPCGEVPLLDNEPCNLGSINLSKFVIPSNNKWDTSLNVPIDWSRLQETVRIAIRYLDTVLDNNSFPDESITEAAYLTRKLGLGVMGWADMLALLYIHYDSEEAVELGEELMFRINEWAKQASNELAIEKGVAPCFDGERQQVNLRNATRTCIAPTGSISTLLNVSGGIEPHFELEWDHIMGDGTILHRRAYSLDVDDSFIPHTAGEIEPIWHLRHQAAFQRNTDLAVSKTINLPNEATVEDIYNIYVQAWQLGTKGVTVFRDGSRSEQVLNRVSEVTTLDTYEATDNRVGSPTRSKLPKTRNSITHKFRVGDHEGYLTVGLYGDGSPGELFIKASKEGTMLAGLMDTVGIETSFLLQYGIPLEIICEKLRGITFEPLGLTDNKDIPTATSMVDYVAHWMQHQFLNDQHEERLTYPIGEIASVVGSTGIPCPECGKSTYAQEGCIKCSCGWSRC